VIALLDNDMTGAGLANNNTAVGASAMVDNTDGAGNTAVGTQALFSNTQSDNNTAVGLNALMTNISAGNSALGRGALQSKQLGSLNTAMGTNALFSLTGVSTMHSNNNTAVGAFALTNLTAGDANTAVGITAGTTLVTCDRNLYIANQGPNASSESDTIRIGNGQTATFIAGISGQEANAGDPVFITTSGKLGTVNPPSSARFKEEIKPMNQASEAILALKPVTFRYKKEFDPTHIPQFGLVAEEVEKVNPDLVKRDREGKVQTVRYDAVNAMLLNEFLKEHREVQELWEIIADNLSEAGWSLGCVSAVDSEGRTIWITGAHCGDGNRFIACADQKLTAFCGTSREL